MTVLLREKTDIRGVETEIKVFRPSGVLSREHREQAEALDKFLSCEVSLIADRIMQMSEIKPLQKWYQFGKGLHQILDDNDLVSRTDLENGLIWEAIKQHLPESIALKGSGIARDAKAKYAGSRSHLAMCYAIAEHAWKDVRWMKRWRDWTEIYTRESVRRDKRVLRSLRTEIKRMEQYPSKEVFREIVKSLSAQTTGKDIKILDDSVIAEKVHHAFEQTQLVSV